MPERNGYEVAAFIKGQPALQHIPVVLLTGAFEPVDEARAKSVGCDGVLVKPFEPQIVISRVKDLLAGQRPPGAWGAAPAAQGPVRQPAPPAPVRGLAASGDSLEAYFDQLDAAFNGAGGETPPAAPGAPRQAIPIARRQDPGAPGGGKGDPLTDWDPDLVGDPARPAPAEPIAFPQRAAASATDTRPAAPGPVAVPPSQPAPVPPPQAAPQPPGPALPPSLVDAFAALLAAEQRIGLTPSAATVPAAAGSGTPASTAPAASNEDIIEEVSRRVLARLGNQSRPAILDVAERLVRDEIDRIKQSGNL
jgi:CheY-like chemotaxis protein